MTPKQQLALVKINHPKHLDQLVSDPKTGDSVKQNIAFYGNDTHRDKLLKDPKASDDVKQNIAKYGNKEHATKLLKHSDSNNDVREAARYRLKELGEKK